MTFLGTGSALLRDYRGTTVHLTSNERSDLTLNPSHQLSERTSHQHESEPQGTQCEDC